MISNPFDITKAVDYTDAEIYKYWVDLGNENHGFERLIKPDTLIPMIIVGSKGSGKTHVMKYFSYELQKIRCLAQSTSMQEGLAREIFHHMGFTTSFAAHYYHRDQCIRLD